MKLNVIYTLGEEKSSTLLKEVVYKGYYSAGFAFLTYISYGLAKGYEGLCRVMSLSLVEYRR